ncbi:DNA internalization-related competence protein ComEC/Rec2 [Neptunomonas japonica]|uniref:Competence protein ComEC n=1 Tax=Neptunomonas japonica JAMM 1380 TaxID=1441457 RepID=A0A7R6SVY7_9GAMM|nr:DNA internalization-related competence protein ComEC/Rec2 [Neptunomonas japonica]BBB30089.1 competence protein ComEC [Neptunomonas japonica JAMM 1380]
MIIYIVGFFVIAWLPFLPPLYWLLCFPIVLIFSFYYFRSLRFQLLALMAGLTIALIYGHIQLQYRWHSSDAASTWRVEGTVDGLPDYKSKHITFNLRISSALNAVEAGVQPESTPRIIRLSWYRTDERLKPGDLLELDVKLRPPHSLWNPGGFDYERWALGRDIDAVGYVKALYVHQPVSSASIDVWRFSLIEWLGNRLRLQPVVLSTLQALLLGDKSGFVDWQWSLLRSTGTTHLMVVSGLHIGVCVLLGWWFGRIIAALLFRGKESRIPHHWLSVVVALLVSGSYVALAGFSIPTQRAWIMAAVLLGAQLVMRRPSVWFRWWLALAIVLTLHPLAVHEVGAWLSFAAVAALLFLVTARQKSAGWLMLLKSQWWIFLVLSPLMLLFFSQVSISAPFVNILAIPFLSLLLLLIVPAMLLEAAGVSWGLDFVGVLIQSLWDGLAWVNGLSDHGVVYIQQPSFMVILFAGLGAVMVLQPISIKLKALGVLCWLPLFVPPQSSVPSGRMSAVVFDVGQGTAMIIRTHGHTLLYDTGAAYPNGNTAFERSVLPYLRLKGIEFIDKLIVSHEDNDHAGGVSKVIEVMRIGAIESGMPDAINVTAQLCRVGVSWQWDGVYFRYIHPKPSLSATDNDRSCVLEVRSKACSLLITGDASVRIEEEVLANSDARAPIHWLVAGHHGSRTSTGVAFLEAYKPKNTLISAGFLNRYGHPHEEVLSRIKAAGSQVFRTDQQGALILDETTGDECRVETWRQKEKRYWTAS